MDADQLAAEALSQPGAWLDEPWEGDHVAKVGDRIFVFLGSHQVGLKCGRTREEADELVAQYPGAVGPMPYLARYGWNTIALDGTISDAELAELLDASYRDVVSRLPKSKRP